MADWFEHEGSEERRPERVAGARAYGDISYHTLPTTGEHRVAKTFGKDLPAIHGGQILDLGCSVGYTTDELAHLYPDCAVIGIDIDKQAIRTARHSGRKGVFFVADGYFPQKHFDAHSFDAIFAMNNLNLIIDRLSASQLKGILSNIRKIIKPGGYLLIGGDFNYYVFRVRPGKVELEATSLKEPDQRLLTALGVSK